MIVADWIRYNEGVLKIDDVIVKVFRKPHPHQENKAIDTKMKLVDMAQIFGEYAIMFINFAEYKMEHLEEMRTTLCFGIYYNKEELTNDGPKNT